RVDDESVEALSATVQDELFEAVTRALPEVDAVIVEDYNKGLLTPEFTQRVISAAREAEKPVFVDPARISDYGKYRGASVLKPNRYEASLASGIDISDEASLAAAADRLLEITEADAMVISLDREGMYLGRRDESRRIPHRCPRSVYDVTGAGDETLAVLAVAFARGCAWEEAVEL